MKIIEDGKTIEMEQKAESIYISVSRRVDQSEIKHSIALTANALNYATVVDTLQKLLDDQ